MILFGVSFWSLVRGVSATMFILALFVFVMMSFTLLPLLANNVTAHVHIVNGSTNVPQQENVIPRVLIINPDTKVRWVNDDIVPHMIISDKHYWEFLSGNFQSPILYPGDSYEYVFRDVGVVKYYMIQHPWMTGTIHVVPRV